MRSAIESKHQFGGGEVDIKKKTRKCNKEKSQSIEIQKLVQIYI